MFVGINGHGKYFKKAARYFIPAIPVIDLILTHEIPVPFPLIFCMAG